MSLIDVYRHKCIGVVNCPSTYPIVGGNDTHRNVPIYRLDEDAADWHAKRGDLLLGGGSGESAAMRISIPEAIFFLTRDDWDDFGVLDEIYYPYWSMNDAFVFCEGYSKIGWQPWSSIETWLAEHIIAFILREFPEQYANHQGSIKLEQDGNICRLPIPNSFEENL